MGRIPITLALFVSLGVSTHGSAQESTTSPAQQVLSEVRFHDGSVVRMSLLEPALEVKTKYGKLTIPLTDIRRIEVGLHIPADVNQQIANSIKRLSSPMYRDRDGAGKYLVGAGHFALPSLQKASRSSDQEVAYRAAGLVKQISERVQSDLLKLRDDDVIHTTDFIVVGKIESPTLKASSPHFGQVTLKLSELRTIHVKQQAGKQELVVDAAKNGSALDQWCDTNITIDASQRVLVTAEGSVDLWPQGPGQYVAAPKGYNTAGKGGQFLAGSLIGKIGENGKAFYIGERYEGVVTEEGRLYLLVVPSPWNNASTGSYRVRVQTDSASIAGR